MTKKNLAIIGGGIAVVGGVAAIIARKAISKIPVKGLRYEYKSHNGIGNGMAFLKKKTDSKTVISELVEKPYVGDKKFPVPSTKGGNGFEKPPIEFFKMHGIKSV